MDLTALVLATDRLGEVSERLNQCNHSDRMRLLYSLNRKALGRLYQLAITAPPLTLDFFIGDRGPLEPVAHEGWNSIPVPTLGANSEKCFANQMTARIGLSATMTTDPKAGLDLDIST